MSRHVIPDPYPETIGVSALTISAPEDFRGTAEIRWWYPGKSADAFMQRMTCSCVWLLQGVFRDMRGPRPGERFDVPVPAPEGPFAARVVALVLHAFYRTRIEAAAKLEASYEWRSYPMTEKTP